MSKEEEQAPLNDGAANKSRATLKDIAKECGVHFATVSAVLHGGRTGTRVSAGLQELIRAAAARMGYRPNLAARALRTGGSRVIGVADGFPLSSPGWPLIIAVNQALKAACGEFERNVMIPWSCPVITTDYLIQWANSGLVDGLLILPGPLIDMESLSRSCRVPLACIVSPSPFAPSFACDEEQGGRMQARLLFEKGHRRVVYHALKPRVAILDERRKAFMAEAKARGMRVDTVRTLTVEDICRVPCHRVRRLMDQEAPPTAIAAWSDLPAHLWIRTLRGAGFRIPNDMAVCGFGCLPGHEGLDYTLTTLDSGLTEMVRRAVESLCQGESGRIEGALTQPSLVQGTTA